MADGKIGYGSTVRIRRATPATTAEIALVQDIEMPDEQIDEVDVTHMKSPGRRKQFIAGLIDGGEVSIPHNYIPGSPTDILLKEIKASGEQVVIEITLTEDGEPEGFSGYLSGYGRTAPIGDKMTATATFRLSEAIEVTP